jgi:signal transduction histidine kinase
MSVSNDLYARMEDGKPWVLLIDDDPNILDTGKDILEEKGFIIDTAGNGAAAMGFIEQKSYNVVVVDFQLPDATGLELARKIRERNPHTCVILMTGHASLEMAVRAIQEAVYDYLIKPVDPALLQKTIEKALEKQRLTLENAHLLDELKTANDMMARLDNLKSKMLAVMSHDLRTPLASIRGYAELLKSGVKGRMTEDQKRVLEIAMQEADHLNGLIGDLLDLANIEAGRLSLDTRPATIEEVIHKALPRIKHSSEMKEVPVEVVMGAEAATVQLDVSRMGQVVSNLLRIALKQAPRGGRVFLSVHPMGERIELRISHNGQGFDAETLQRLFTWSNKPVSETAGSQDGLRVGLAIAREIVEAHGGEIGVSSNGSDHGTTFWLRLPIMKNTETTRAA